MSAEDARAATAFERIAAALERLAAVLERLEDDVRTESETEA